MKTLVLKTVIVILIPLFVLFATFMFFRGHAHPGGGFIAGLLASIPYMIYAMAFGRDETAKKFRTRPRALAGAGLLLAFTSGLFAIASGEAFMGALWIEGQLPLIGSFGTPILFDLGVAFVVIGVVLEITFLLSEQ